MRLFWQRRDEADPVSAVEAAPAAAGPGPGIPEPDLTAAAFFDVDNTMMRGASIYYFARGLASRKFFTVRDLASFIWVQASFRIRGTENADHISSPKQAHLGFVAGQKVADLITLCEEIYDEVLADRIWAGTRTLALQHLDAGQQVWLVTATPVEIARVIAHRLGLTGALGTVAESVDGVYTGRLVGNLLHGPAKSEAVRAPPATPAAGRRAHAGQHAWRIHDFRTGRKVTMIALPAAAGAGALAGGVAA